MVLRLLRRALSHDRELFETISVNSECGLTTLNGHHGGLHTSKNVSSRPFLKSAETADLIAYIMSPRKGKGSRQECQKRINANGSCKLFRAVLKWFDQMDIFRFRTELKHLTDRELLEIASQQKEEHCILGGLCQYKIIYKGAGFCISELKGKGCEKEYLRKLFADEDVKSEHPSSEEALQLPIGFRFPDPR